jgi:signal transduction histidine kinase
VGIFGLTRRLYERHCDLLGDTAKEYCRQILRASEQIVNLVDRINTFIMTKEAPLHFEKIDVKEIAAAIRSEFAEALSKRGVEWSEAEDLPVIVADKMSITRVLRNLVDNALKYGGENLSKIEIQVKENGEYHYIFVNDNGIAVKEEDAEKLFKLYHRSETSKGVEGTGLGLAIIKELAERHRGGAWLEPARGAGTTFCVAISKKLKSEK